MKSRHLPSVLVVSFVAFTASTAAVHAAPWREVAIGLNLFDYQINGERNLLGRGWDINATAVYSGQRYNFGFADLVLGSPASPTVSNISVGYTTRGIPRAEFNWSTGGRALPYTFRINNGIQDFTTINGSILVDVSTDINVLGFYDTRVQISNRGQYSTDGFLADEQGNLAFDIGPIDISGNIYADALAAVTAPLWAATGTQNPFAKFSERATKTAQVNATVDELRARIEAGEILSDDDMARLVNSTLVSAILTGDANAGRFLTDFALPTSKQSVGTMRLAQIPEPTSALLVLGTGMLLMRRRPRR